MLLGQAKQNFFLFFLSELHFLFFNSFPQNVLFNMTTTTQKKDVKMLIFLQEKVLTILFEENCPLVWKCLVVSISVIVFYCRLCYIYRMSTVNIFQNIKIASLTFKLFKKNNTPGDTFSSVHYIITQDKTKSLVSLLLHNVSKECKTFSSSYFLIKPNPNGSAKISLKVHNNNT